MEYNISLVLNCTERYVKFIPVVFKHSWKQGLKEYIHVPYGSVYIGKEHKNSSYKTFVNNVCCFGTKHEKPHRVTLTFMDEAWNLR